MLPILKKMTPVSDRCRTRYPIILVHGVGHRDSKVLGYWGRIPHALAKEGATVFHGNQDAWSTIQKSAEALKKRVLEILKQTGAEKVNLIAHSKGGLDARYMITHCGMASKVASLTTICTPHRGSVVIDKIATLSEPYFLVYGVIMDQISKLFGDENPDFYRASRQLTAPFMQLFNQRTPNVKGVYYQSYTSVMNTPLGDLFYWLPFLITSQYEGENDGLVAVDSARWGNFRGVVRPEHFRGISHSHMVDASRLNFHGFDIQSFYINLVSELKEKGF